LIALPAESPAESRPNPIAAVPSPPPPTACLPSGLGVSSAPLDPELKARQNFLATGRGNCAAFRKLFQAFAAARTPAERNLRLQDLNRKVQFVAEAAGLAKCQAIAQLAGAYEAMLLAAMDAPARVGSSVMLTAMRGIDFLEGLFQQPAGAVTSKPFSGNILVVDSDAASNRLVLAAFRQAKLQAQSIEDSITAWQWVNQKPYDLLFLDLLMPGLAGPEFCKRMRTLPGYESTPVIYIVTQNEFEQQAQVVLGSGEDLISKPLFPTELVLKALMHRLSRHSASTPFTASAQTGHTSTPASAGPAG
jgi:CheY-like chemotaxis protein